MAKFLQIIHANPVIWVLRYLGEGVYSDKSAHAQVVINCRNTDAPMCTLEDVLAYILGAPSIVDVMSYIMKTSKRKQEIKGLA